MRQADGSGVARMERERNPGPAGHRARNPGLRSETGQVFEQRSNTENLILGRFDWHEENFFEVAVARHIGNDILVTNGCCKYLPSLEAKPIKVLVQCRGVMGFAALYPSYLNCRIADCSNADRVTPLRSSKVNSSFRLSLKFYLLSSLAPMTNRSLQ
jgi:hypothetical protein